MTKLSEIPRAGEPDAVSKYLEAHNDRDLPARFIDFVIAHIDAGHAFKNDSELGNALGGILLGAETKSQLRTCLEHAQRALGGNLEQDKKRHYEMIVTCMNNAIARINLPD